MRKKIGQLLSGVAVCALWANVGFGQATVTLTNPQKRNIKSAIEIKLKSCETQTDSSNEKLDTTIISNAKFEYDCQPKNGQFKTLAFAIFQQDIRVKRASLYDVCNSVVVTGWALDWRNTNLDPHCLFKKKI